MVVWQARCLCLVAAAFSFTWVLIGGAFCGLLLRLMWPCLTQMLGMHGTVVANYAVDHADLLLAFGVRFDDRVTGKLEAFAVLPHLQRLCHHELYADSNALVWRLHGNWDDFRVPLQKNTGVLHLAEAKVWDFRWKGKNAFELRGENALLLQARARIVHVDIDPAEINKNKASHVTVCADTKPCLAVRTPPTPDPLDTLCVCFELVHLPSMAE